MRELRIEKNDADQRVDKFIMKTLKTMPKSLMYKYIRNKKIKVNGKRCEIAQRLQVGDVMQCYIAEEFFEHLFTIDEHFLKVPKQLDVIYEDDAFLIVNKPYGLLAHSDKNAIQDNLADRVLHYLYSKKEYDPQHEQSFTPALCHRIDRNTQGIVIAAKTSEALREMNEKIRNREVDKRYLCIVEGHLSRKQAIIELYHKKLDHNKADICAYEKPGYQLIKTGYKVLSQKRGYSLVEICLYTGKSHQIRALMGYLNHPLLGDRKYGAKESEWRYQALCAYQIRFQFIEKRPVLKALDGKTFTLSNIELLSYFEQLP